MAVSLRPQKQKRSRVKRQLQLFQLLALALTCHPEADQFRVSDNILRWRQTQPGHQVAGLKLKLRSDGWEDVGMESELNTIWQKKTNDDFDDQSLQRLHMQRETNIQKNPQGNFMLIRCKNEDRPRLLEYSAMFQQWYLQLDEVSISYQNGYVRSSSPRGYQQMYAVTVGSEEDQKTVDTNLQDNEEFHQLTLAPRLVNEGTCPRLSGEGEDYEIVEIVEEPEQSTLDWLRSFFSRATQ